MDSLVVSIIAIALAALALSSKVVDLMKEMKPKSKKSSDPPPARPQLDTGNSSNGVQRIQCETEMSSVRLQLSELKDEVRGERGEILREMRAMSERLRAMELSMARIEGRQETAEKERKK